MSLNFPSVVNRSIFRFYTNMMGCVRVDDDFCFRNFTIYLYLPEKRTIYHPSIKHTFTQDAV